MLNHTKRLLFASSLLAVAATVVNAADPADQKPSDPKPTQAAGRTAESVVRPAVEGAGGVMIFKDPVTGQIRAPEPGEVQALTASKQKSVASVAPETPVKFKSPTGAGIGFVLPASSRSYMVVTKTSDGKLKESCVVGDKAANAVVTAGPAPTTKGALDEK
ncbi:post-PEP-CTERM-1 domain-containing protein [Paludibaculum fermentans]|uniref:post-PEP-CTERM-1 domain-containing protein n=1 Tax=Paludibaculum fermentans TaxID=1473598 RepID=UPI003EC04321